MTFKSTYINLQRNLFRILALNISYINVKVTFVIIVIII